MNKVILSGRLTRDPEVRYSESGFSVAKMTIAVDRPKRKDGGERETDFIDLTAFGKRAEFLERNGFKGQRVIISGRLQVSKYEIGGETKKRTEVILDDVDLLEWSDKPADRMERLNEEAFVF